MSPATRRALAPPLVVVGLYLGSVSCGARSELEPSLADGSATGSLHQDYVAVMVGACSVCGLRSSGAVQCAGSYGAPLDGESDVRPAAIANIPGPVARLARRIPCAVLPNGAVECWGGEWSNSCFDAVNNPTGICWTAVQIPFEAPVRELSGWNGILNDGQVIEWHYIGTYQFQFQSSIIPLPAPAQDIDMDCATLMDGRVACWGECAFGLCGPDVDWTWGQPPVPPVVLPGIADAVQIASWSHACAITSSGSVYCWGRNLYGQVGVAADGPGTETRNYVPSVPYPVQKQDLPGVASRVATTSEGESTCVLTTDGAVYCWGANDVGQLGNGEARGACLDQVADCHDLDHSHDTPAAQRVLLSGPATFIDADVATVCAVVEGHIECWGGELCYSISGTTLVPASIYADKLYSAVPVRVL